jgi:hypothetical protein
LKAGAKLQGMYRMYAARVRCREVTKICYEKRYNREVGRYYYVFVPREELKHSADAYWQWAKPRGEHACKHSGLFNFPASPLGCIFLPYLAIYLFFLHLLIYRSTQLSSTVACLSTAQIHRTNGAR